MTGTRAVIAAVGVALVLGVAACSGDDPEPKVAPPSTSAPSSPSTSPASEPTQEDFVRSYFESIGRATVSGDTTDFLAMSSGSCGNCRILAQNIKNAFAGRRHVEGANWQIDEASNVGRRQGGDVWNVDVKTAEERWYDGSGDLIKIVDASTQHFGVIVATNGEGYRIADMRLRS